MPSSSFVFFGHPAYLEAAAAELGRPELALAAGRLAAVSALANLCAQASRTEPANVAAILAKASEFRDQLAIALQAADAMIADVESATRFHPEPDSAEVESPPRDDLPDDDPSPVVPQRRHMPHRKGGRG